MRVDPDLSGKERPKAASVPAVVLSRWVNEPYPPLTELLSAHDVARLTRRPRWLLLGLALIGRFPKRVRFRGRALGWWRSDVLEWIEKDLLQPRKMSPRQCWRRQPRQTCLPLETRNRRVVIKGALVAKRLREE
jgi:predicted DNA-binding transcriptional regulator AlpA